MKRPSLIVAGKSSRQLASVTTATKVQTETVIIKFKHELSWERKISRPSKYDEMNVRMI